MRENLQKSLIDEDIFQYGSNELMLYEKRLTQYFTREYKLHLGNNQHVSLNNGPLALAAEELADDHYNEGIPFFQSFLDTKTMSYTMAYFDENSNMALASRKSLEQAQTDKFKLIAQRLELKGDEHLLNIGCGFGYFESYLLDTYPQLRVSSTTHSKDQYEFVLNRMNQHGDSLSSGRFRVFFGEINRKSSLNFGKGEYDAVCSVGLLEQINNIEQFFKIIDELLTDNGRMFHHLIMSRDLIPQFLDPDKTLIGKYFPGGKVLPFYALKKDFGNFRLILYLSRQHYS